jgi:hypothetical protein
VIEGLVPNLPGRAGSGCIMRANAGLAGERIVFSAKGVKNHHLEHCSSQN